MRLSGQGTRAEGDPGQCVFNCQPKPDGGTMARNLEGSDLLVDTRFMGAKQSQKKATKTKPVCQAMLLCDTVIRDESTHKTTVVGIFDTFYLISLPGYTSRCMIFLRLVDAVGRFEITAEVRDPARGIVLFRSPGAGQFGHPRKRTCGEMSLPVAPLAFDQDGDYHMVVFADEWEIGRAQFKVKLQSPWGS
jgi:Family of unknown function (DUF6941)